MKFEVGQGIRGCVRRRYFYGVILDISNVDKTITFALVDNAMGVKCYDDAGALYERDHNNVRLKDSPPPFVRLSGNENGGAYVYADMSNLITYDAVLCKKHGIQIIDKGALVSEREMEEIRYHPWQEQSEREKSVYDKRVADLDSRFGDIECLDNGRDDNQFGD